MNILLMANWGLGLEVLNSLNSITFVRIKAVVSRFNPQSTDPWENRVYEQARSLGIETINEKKMNLKTLETLIVNTGIDLLVTHAFMRRLPKMIFDTPALGCMNIHPSLLPKYRGPSPTQWVVKNKETETGLTSHFIDEGIDTGKIISQRVIPVSDSDTVVTIIDKLKKEVTPLLTVSLNRIRDPYFVPIRQNNDWATYAPRIGE